MNNQALLRSHGYWLRVYWLQVISLGTTFFWLIECKACMHASVFLHKHISVPLYVQKDLSCIRNAGCQLLRGVSNVLKTDIQFTAVIHSFLQDELPYYKAIGGSF